MPGFNKQEQLARAQLLNQQAAARGEKKPVLAIPKPAPSAAWPVRPNPQPWPFAAAAPTWKPCLRDKDGKSLSVGDKVAYLGYVNGTPRLMTGVVLSMTASAIFVNTRQKAITKFHNVVRLA